MSELLDLINKHMSLASKLVIGWGVVITWGYCAFLINFFPTGLNLADGLVFVFIALGFGLVYFLWLLMGFMICYFGHLIFEEPLSSDRKKAAWQRLEKAMYAIVCLTFLALLGYLAFRLESPESFVAPCASGFILYITAFKWRTSDSRQSMTPAAMPASNEAGDSTLQSAPASDPQSSLSSSADRPASAERARWRIVIAATAIFLVPTMAIPALGKIIRGSFSFIGIQQGNVSLALNEENRAVVDSIAKELDLSIYGCMTTDNKSYIAHHFNVLWHGLGERSLVQLLAYEDEKWKPRVTIELERTGMKVLRAENKDTAFTTCRTLQADALFDHYEDQLNKYGKQQLSHFADEMLKLQGKHLAIDAATITGYTDRMPVLRSGDSNIELSARRAESVYVALQDQLPADLQVKRIGQGSLSPRSSCPAEMSRAALKECLAVDRRVEVQLRLAERKPDGPASSQAGIKTAAPPS